MAQNRIIFITGRKGSGKSTYANKAAAALVAKGERVLVVDPMACFTLPGVPVFADPRQLSSVKFSSAILRADDDNAAVAAFVYAWHCGNIWLIVDEVDLYCSPYNSDPTLKRIVRYGRHKAINLIAISQRPANVARDVTAQADAIVIFSTTENRDLDYLRYRIGETAALAASKLPLYQSIIYKAGTVEPAGSSQIEPKGETETME